MILGIDVGGTRTDSVLVEKGRVLGFLKIDTKENLLETISEALQELLKGFDPKEIRRGVFSTTLATNAIVQDKMPPAAMMVMAGPGIDPMELEIGPCYHVISGIIDHQGFEVRPVNKQEVLRKAQYIKTHGIDLLGVVEKFSPRNPDHELEVSRVCEPFFSYISLGHRLSGLLNFPRRVNTTYLNASLFPIQRDFSQALELKLGEMGVSSPRLLLKPDGGTIILSKSQEYAVWAAQSGPAASVIGALFLDGCKDITLVLDVGGTTTDMSIVLDGTPILAPLGVELGPYKTLVRSIYTRSVGVGGDSVVVVTQEGKLGIGPERKGPPVAFGGRHPTPTDAMVTLNMLAEGNRQRAAEAVKEIGQKMGIEDVYKASEVILRHTAALIAKAAKDFVGHLNSKPVYTIHEALYERRVEPDRIVVIGGPARQLAPYISDALELPYSVPPYAEVANAIGAAVSKVTAEVSVYANTQKGSLVIPERDLHEKIPFRFTEREALSRGEEALRQLAISLGADGNTLELQVVERSIFNIVKGFYRTGQNMRFRLSVKPGIITQGV